MRRAPSPHQTCAAGPTGSPALLRQDPATAAALVLNRSHSSGCSAGGFSVQGRVRSASLQSPTGACDPLLCLPCAGVNHPLPPGACGSLLCLPCGGVKHPLPLVARDSLLWLPCSGVTQLACG